MAVLWRLKNPLEVLQGCSPGWSGDPETSEDHELLCKVLWSTRLDSKLKGTGPQDLPQDKKREKSLVRVLCASWLLRESLVEALCGFFSDGIFIR